MLVNIITKYLMRLAHDYSMQEHLNIKNTIQRMKFTS